MRSKSEQFKTSNDASIVDAAKTEKAQNYAFNLVAANSIRNTKEELELKCQEARDNPLAKHGTNQHGKEETGGDNITSTQQRGTGTTYTLRRLARDCPELLDRTKAGLKTSSFYPVFSLVAWVVNLRTY